jgi:DNA-binding NarL/FixJ family response regulator
VAGPNREGQAIDGCGGAVPLGELMYFDHGLNGRARRRPCASGQGPDLRRAPSDPGRIAHAPGVARRVRPDVVLMDIRMPKVDGIEATVRILKPGIATKIMILTTFDLDEYVFAALRAGASGFLLKDTPPADLLAAIRVIAAGEALLAPTVTRRLIEEFARRPTPARRSLAGVTGREEEVLCLIGAGRSNGEIARQLQLTVATVKTHVGRLLMELQARDRAQLVIAAYEAGLAPVNESPEGYDRRP